MMRSEPEAAAAAAGTTLSCVCLRSSSSAAVKYGCGDHRYRSAGKCSVSTTIFEMMFDVWMSSLSSAAASSCDAITGQAARLRRAVWGATGPPFVTAYAVASLRKLGLLAATSAATQAGVRHE